MKYPLAMRTLHWLMALIIFGLIALGIYMSDLPKEDPSRMDLYNLHKSFGFTILILFFVRLGIRLKSKIPELPSEISAKEKKLAKAGHHTLYLLIFLVPFAGVLFSNLYGYGIYFFGLDIPPFFPQNAGIAESVGEIHGFLAYTLLALVGVHVLGALKHQFIDKINLLNRMS